MPYPFIESPHRTDASGRAIGVVVIHTMEIAERDGAAEVCARWFAEPGVGGLGALLRRCRHDDPVRARGRHRLARAGRERELDRDRARRLRGPAVARLGRRLQPRRRRARGRGSRPRCARGYGIPLRRLRAADLVAGRRGVTGHADVSAAFRKSDHWDPGPDFPWARFLRLARGSDVVERAARGLRRSRRARRA